MARDRKRAKQRRERGARRSKAPEPAASQPVRADVPGALDHASGEVDEFDAALVRGAGGVPAPDTEPEPAPDAEAGSEPPSNTLSEHEIEAEAELEGDLSENEVQELEADAGSGGGGAVVSPKQASGAPIRGGKRAIGFLRASGAELQRVQGPDRRQVTQATAVVIGFVAIAGLYLGLADEVAKEIVEFIL